VAIISIFYESFEGSRGYKRVVPRFVDGDAPMTEKGTVDGLEKDGMRSIGG